MQILKYVLAAWAVVSLAACGGYGSGYSAQSDGGVQSSVADANTASAEAAAISSIGATTP